MRKIKEEEKDILLGHYRRAGCALIRERAHAILLSEQGKNAVEIGNILFRKDETIREWIGAFNEKGISSVFHRYEGNMNASKLTKEQREEIKNVLQSQPSEQGIPKEFWDVKILEKYLEGEFGVVYESERSYHYLLKLANLSFKLPTPFDRRRNNEGIEKRMKEIEEELKRYWDHDEWVILTADETRLTWEAEIRRAWLKKNQKTVIRVERDAQYQNYFGALNLKTGESHIVRLRWQDQENMIVALQEISKHYEGKRICLLWDNARWHKGKKLREELAQGKSLTHFHLIALPPYAPDKNPQEHVWKYGKDVIANDTQHTFEAKLSVFEKALHQKQFNYRL